MSFFKLKKMDNYECTVRFPFQENCSCDGNCDLQEIGEDAVLLKGQGIYYVKIPHLQSLSYEW